MNDKREDLRMKVDEALSRLLKSGKITQQEYDIFLNHYLSRNDEENILDELLKMFTETNYISQKLFDIENLNAYDVGNMNGEHVDMSVPNIPSYSINNMSVSNIPSYNINNMDDFGINIVEVDDGAESEFTGVIPLSDFKNKINDTNYINPVDNNSIIRDNLNEYEEIGEGNSFGIQKTIGTHPGTGKHFHFGEDSGFMTFILVMFLAGISMGIIFMIIMNFLAK